MKYIFIFCLCLSFDIFAEQSDDGTMPIATGFCGVAGKEISHFISKATFQRLKNLDPSKHWQLEKIVATSGSGPYKQHATFERLKKTLISENIEYKKGSATQETDPAIAAKKFALAMGGTIDEAKLADLLKHFLGLNDENMLVLIKEKNNVTLLTYEKFEEVYGDQKHTSNCVYLHLAPNRENVQTHLWQ